MRKWDFINNGTFPCRAKAQTCYYILHECNELNLLYHLAEVNNPLLKNI